MGQSQAISGYRATCIDDVRSTQTFEYCLSFVRVALTARCELGSVLGPNMVL